MLIVLSFLSTTFRPELILDCEGRATIISHKPNTYAINQENNYIRFKVDFDICQLQDLNSLIPSDPPTEFVENNLYNLKLNIIRSILAHQN
jgi:hypothetical protein